MIGETLSAAYELRQDSQMFDNGDDAMFSSDDEPRLDDSRGSSDHMGTIHANSTSPITPEIKAEIADEVKQELATDNAEASAPQHASFDALSSALRQPDHVFVVSTDLDVTTSTRETCGLQAGDMLQLLSPAADAALIQLRVASTQRMDCPVGTTVNVSLTDLQDMQNAFQERVECGLGALRNGQGRNGLPAAPSIAIAVPPNPSIDGLASESPTAASATIDQLGRQADEVESQALKSTF
jgi:hypothetical protein